MSFLYLQFSQKMKEKIRSNYYGTSSRIVFFRFLEELKKSKRHFEINWPLGRAENFSRICHAIYVNAMMTVPPTIRFMLSLLFYRVSYIALIYVFFKCLKKLKFSSLLKALGTITYSEWHNSWKSSSLKYIKAAWDTLQQLL